jgi:hypothetical protein
MKKAKVALARKLAVVMHRMLVDGTLFKSAAVAADNQENVVSGMFSRALADLGEESFRIE